ncbi:similarity to DNA damage tolerance protein RAD31 RA31_SCHPO [Encephalitozoon cuniculi GB-M1]|uniref:Similarity to DNA damage tolerance protein RAD31 RA31_SCHPO n=2 Tax=Encephalitozoon cuniculi TaxID=6035 RepID=Q8SUS5_ENCCU|nr:E1 ubiquitin activating enzyme-like protein [Encephalitozoon cuniculi GB-M1]AGE95148.1 DNA damage tolerance protein [Encephalitozoon cuniculi]KMV65573.1 E1 ubiquitin activating enzyme-like protein [Encephalitozoon cuniculi EcunIII-L]UYI26972.1 molybdopterin biosynthesis moeb protein [Encephalitozoon cuniculi]CAD26351.1 similarity to DNA damage tolerance protein RAD31 RA31_SCHPO [Encephalitozoon cuniculi GB-M1]
MEEQLYGLYDRQIRLFGKDTQRLIEESHVGIVQGPPYMLEGNERTNDIGGEILKNLVLLGVGRVTVNEHVLRSFRRMFVNEVSKINEKIRVEVIDEEHQEGAWDGYTLVIFIDQKEQARCPSIFVCSRCVAFHAPEKEHLCERHSSVSAAHDCLLGAIVVQEWVKRLQNRHSVDEYCVEL